MKIISVVGARPNFMKIAPFVHAIAQHNEERETSNQEQIEHLLVHTGQHYHDKMSKSFFEALGIPEADVNLGIGSGTHAEQVGNTMIAFEKVVHEHRPDWVVVVGDVNATCACSITAKKEHVKLAHIEAGLRSFDLDMPEEINRMVTDRLSDLLFTPDGIASENLRNEGVCEERIRFVGNIMIDTLEANRAKAEQLDVGEIIEANALEPSRGRGLRLPHSESIASSLTDAAASVGSEVADGVGTDSAERPQRPHRGGRGVADSPAGCGAVCHASPPYAVMTMHRPSNVDDKEVLAPIMEFLVGEVAAEMPVVWPSHPRTRKQLETFGLWDAVHACPGMLMLHPIGYHEMLKLNMEARIALTDSGGLQEECCVLGTPCLTLRWNTERPVTLREHGGASVLVGNDIERIRAAYRETIARDRRPARPPLWDGRTAERIVGVLAKH